MGKDWEEARECNMNVFLFSVCKSGSMHYHSNEGTISSTKIKHQPICPLLSSYFGHSAVSLPFPTAPFPSPIQMPTQRRLPRAGTALRAPALVLAAAVPRRREATNA